MKYVSKNNFVPLSAPSDSGVSLNKFEILDSDVSVLLNVENRLTVDAINAANPLNQSTPFEVEKIPASVMEV